MNLKRRIDKLSNQLTPIPLQEPQFSTEDIAIMQRIINNMYSDPARYAKRIKIFEECRLKCEGQEPMVCQQ